jgi:hypothetical protein
LMDKNLTDLKAKWPSTLVSRDVIDRFSGGIISPRYIANLDCQGLGPSERIRIGRKVAYPIDALCNWLAARSKVLTG